MVLSYIPCSIFSTKDHGELLLLIGDNEQDFIWVKELQAMFMVNGI